MIPAVGAKEAVLAALEAAGGFGAGGPEAGDAEGGAVPVDAAAGFPGGCDGLEGEGGVEGVGGPAGATGAALLVEAGGLAGDVADRPAGTGASGVGVELVSRERWGGIVVRFAIESSVEARASGCRWADAEELQIRVTDEEPAAGAADGERASCGGHGFLLGAADADRLGERDRGTGGFQEASVGGALVSPFVAGGAEDEDASVVGGVGDPLGHELCVSFSLSIVGKYRSLMIATPFS